MKAAAAAYRAGNLEGVLRVLGEAKATSRTCGWQGVALRRLGRREEALATLQLGLKIGPELAWVHAVLGETLREVGGRRRGYVHIQKAVRLDPECGYASDFSTGPSRFEAWVYGCRAGASRAKGDLEGARRDILAALELDAGCGWAWGWLGELELRLQRPAEAVAALDRAVGLFGEWPEAFFWRGESKRLLGAHAPALHDLDHAIALGYKQYDVYLSRGSARLAQGDAAGHLSELLQAVRSAPEVFQGTLAAPADASSRRWIASVLDKVKKAEVLYRSAEGRAEKGRDREALALLRRSIALDPWNAKAFLLRCDTHARLQRPDEAMKDVDEAVRLDPSSATCAKRADLAQKNGYMEAALRDLSVAIAMDPSVELLRWRARAFLGMRHYDLAFQDISAALALEPDNAEMYDLRAHVNLLLGRLEGAQQDVERALRIAPGNVNLHLRLGQILALRGRFEEAYASLEPIRASAPAWVHFATGYIHCIGKRYALAAPQFSLACAQAEAGDTQLRLLSGHYGVVAKAFGALGQGEHSMSKKTKGKAAKDKGTVYLCGLGVYPPQTATIEVLHAISQCDVIFNNLPGPGISEFLGLFCANRRPVAFRYEADAKLCADLVFTEVRAGRKVGFVTFGHPLLFGPLSYEVIQRCRREKIAWKAFGAVSSMDAVLAASGQVLGYSYCGFQLFETMGVSFEEIAVANPKLPAVIYFSDGMGEEGLAKLGKVMANIYSPEHKCLLYGPRHELWETQQEGVAIKDLPRLAQHKLSQGILFVPPQEKKADPAERSSARLRGRPDARSQAPLRR